MGAPADSDIKYYRGANATPTDDAAPIGGAPFTTTELVDTDPNLLFDDTPANPLVTDANIVHRNVAYRKNEEGAAGKAVNGRLYLANGLLLNVAGGTASITAGAADAGKKGLLVGVSGGSIATELLTLINGTVGGSVAWDALQIWRLELLLADGVTPVAAAATVTLTRGVDLGLIPAGRYQATAEYEVAVASAKNTNLSAGNRLTDPTGITAFARAIKIPSNNAALTCPTPINDTEFFGYALRKTLRGGIPAPLLGYIDIRTRFQFTAQA